MLLLAFLLVSRFRGAWSVACNELLASNVDLFKSRTYYWTDDHDICGLRLFLDNRLLRVVFAEAYGILDPAKDSNATEEGCRIDADKKHQITTLSCFCYDKFCNNLVKALELLRHAKRWQQHGKNGTGKNKETIIAFEQQIGRILNPPEAPLEGPSENGFIVVSIIVGVFHAVALLHMFGALCARRDRF
ncbi:hypothetical protein Q1695_012270 [Nippostrongylus brasiliensis]|nr:hypothetical protein Q1695_012270 [Nippostrongylus brasiliensis]